MVLSFIVPCYNVEAFLPFCLDSIYGNDLSESEFEVLCINDCSPDNSLSILNDYASRHTNLRIISHTENKGLGGARNTGIEQAHGEYLWFIDADDIVNSTCISKAIRRCDTENLDVIAFNYNKIDLEGRVLSNHTVFAETPALDGQSFVLEALHNNITGHMGYVWRFLYRTDYLRVLQMHFPEKTYWEDTVFMPKALLLAKRVASISDVLYSYRVNPESISGSFSRAYPAKMIYDLAFVCGRDLLRFSNELEDSCSSKKRIREVAIGKYINGFPLYLLRTSRKERKAFYGLLSSVDITDLSGCMSILSRCLLVPVIGPVLSELFSFAYKMKHRQQ